MSFLHQSKGNVKFIKAYYKDDIKTFKIEFEEALKKGNLGDLKNKIKFIRDEKEINLSENALISISGKNIKNQLKAYKNKYF